MKENINVADFVKFCSKQIVSKSGVRDGSLSTLQRSANKSLDSYEMLRDSEFVLKQYEEQIKEEKEINSLNNVKKEENSFKDSLKIVKNSNNKVIENYDDTRAMFQRKDRIKYTEQKDEEIEIGG